MLKSKLLFTFFLFFSFNLSAQQITKLGKSNLKLTVSGKSEIGVLKKQMFQKNSQVDFYLLKEREDKAGNLHKRYQILLNDIPIKGIQVTSHYKVSNQETDFIIPRSVLNVGNFYMPKSIMTFEDVMLIAKENVIGESYTFIKASSTSSDEGLTFVPKDFNFKKPHWILVYEIDIQTNDPWQSKRLSIHAETGEVLFIENRLCSYNPPGTAVTRYHGTQVIETTEQDGGFVLNDQTRGDGIRTYDLNNGGALFFDEDNFWDNDNAAMDEVAGDVHWGSGAVFDFYQDEIGLNGFDGNGKGIESDVHLNDGNAYWDGNRTSYGDGGGAYDLPFTHINIVAHEITHAVTEYHSGLIYNSESGGLNESISDILGVTLEHYHFPDSVDWLIGDNASSTGAYFRNMANPNDVAMADTYDGEYWNAFNDVHSTSSISNFWYYLLVNGGTGTNDNDLDYDLEGIGWENAWLVANNTWLNYLTPSSDYYECAILSVTVAQNLFGACSAEVMEVIDAWEAVGVLENGFDPNFSASGTIFCEIPASVSFSSFGEITDHLWTFGDGEESTEVNPIHLYQDIGAYTVSLTAMDCNNEPITVTKENYILVDTFSNFCDTIVMESGLDIVTDMCGGILVDDGGTQNNYSNGIFSSVEINVPNAVGYDINFDFFNTEFDYDFLSLYVDIGGEFELYDSYDGNLNPFILSLTTSRIKFIWDSDGSVVEPGFIILWDCISPTAVPIAGFSTMNTATCDPSVLFQDESLEFPSSWSWLIDGDIVSMDQNPILTFTDPGTYDVGLIACNELGCDTLTIEDYITYDPNSPFCDTIVMENDAALFSTDCQGVLVDDGGVANFYENYVYSTLDIEVPDAIAYEISFDFFNTEATYDFLRLYTDTGDGFELYQSFDGILDPFTLQIDANKIRFIWDTDFSVTRPGFVVSWQCQIPTTIPIADFSTEYTSICSPEVSIQDESLEYPTSWSWLIDGDIVSMDQNPTLIFADVGTYDVGLIACNNFGCDTLIVEDYINYDPESPFCDTIVMEDALNSISYDCSGVLLDDGGEFGDYSEEVFSVVTIEAPSAIAYEINFDFFSVQEGGDGLNVYIDNGNGLQFYDNYTGFFQPFNITVEATRIQFVWITDNFINGEGFVISWQCLLPTAIPIADFSTLNTTICNPNVLFEDESLEYPSSWSWLIDDDIVSMDQNPILTFEDPGTYDVGLIACNDFGCDTLIVEDYITYDPNLPFCDTIVMMNDAELFSTNCEGVLVDDGGVENLYENNVYSTLDIEVENGINYELSFDFFNTEATYDFLTLYTDTGNGFEFYENYDGSLDPFTLLIYAEKIRFVWDTDVSVTRPGFVVSWLCNQNIDITLDPQTQQTNCDNVFLFLSNSVNADLVTWDFGDGTTSTGEIVGHQYDEPGEYTVTVEASNLVNTETQTFNVMVSFQELSFNAPDQILVNTNQMISPVGYAQNEIQSIEWFIDGALVGEDYILDLNLSDLGTYELTCTITIMNGCTFTHTETINIVDVLDAGNGIFAVEIIIFPNPTKDEITIQGLSNLRGGVSISLLNNIGELIISEKMMEEKDQTLLNLDQIPSGVYLLKIQNEKGQSLFKKIVKMD